MFYAITYTRMYLLIKFIATLQMLKRWFKTRNNKKWKFRKRQLKCRYIGRELTVNFSESEQNGI